MMQWMIDAPLASAHPAALFSIPQACLEACAGEIKNPIAELGYVVHRTDYSKIL